MDFLASPARQAKAERLLGTYGVSSLKTNTIHVISIDRSTGMLGYLANQRIHRMCG